MPVMLRCPALPHDPRAPRPDGRRVQTSPDGTVETSHWQDGNLHRPSSDGPALTAVSAEGRVLFALYAEHGEIHRDPLAGPAYHLTNAVTDRAEYCLRGRLSRDPAQGPAVIVRDAEGHVIHEEFWKDGVLIESRDPPPANRSTRRAAKARRRRA